MKTKVQILGAGCPKCRALTRNTVEAVRALGMDADIEKVDSMADIIAMGALMTPALAVHGVVRSSGRLLSVEQVKRVLAGVRR